METKEITAIIKDIPYGYKGNSEMDLSKASELINKVYELAKLSIPKIVVLDSPEECEKESSIELKFSKCKNRVWLRFGLFPISRNIFKINPLEPLVIDTGNKSLIGMEIMLNKLKNNSSNRLLFSFGNMANFNNWANFYQNSNTGNIDSRILDRIGELLPQNIFFIIFHNNTCFISRPPVLINTDELGRLHSKDYPAIAFRDGFGGYYLYGIYFSSEDFKKYVETKSITGKDILSIRNVEQKAALIKLHGYEKILENLNNLHILNEYKIKSRITGKETTCQVLEFSLDNSIIRILKLEDHSVHKITFLGIPILKQTEKCLGAIAWSFGLKTKDYKPLLES